ncbi:hypothetical protein PIB30_110182, partial [Stylosanthes scabra]|nr:hypothetical protein [Stylosanthes scabra]
VTPNHAYAWIESQPDHAYAWWISHPRICMENTLLAANTRPAHRREIPRLCVESSLKSHSRVTPDHAYAWWISHPRYAWKTLWQQAQDPRIGVKFHAYAWKAHSSHIPGSVIHAYAWKTRESPRICVESSFRSQITPSPAQTRTKGHQNMIAQHHSRLIPDFTT